MSRTAILENVRRYRTIASLCRQTAAYHPAQKWTLLEEASASFGNKFQFNCAALFRREQQMPKGR